ncbi:DNA cytosine methyltransferase [Alterisphingorhabdus coralli]|uniref:Cytosine-specific methyltransferase n=1 Tax=Alterisphingorhabdus coralli TaxID=3071408 RepID=A0AA97F7S6_9SPHN|nr:DNA cytosine methyltransferase [Parasphingorhabdus sp. SCSIO 66989]WOE74652.1 DNA cytosine methyltransferase [Parasphingorhabdus sp. SCSIO 66989]
MEQLTCVDLFSGCGGFGLGAEQAGYKILAAVDNDSDLQSAYKLNFPKTWTMQADIEQLDRSAWSFLLGRGKPRLDLLIGGPPCQGFSRIGLRQKNDPRNTLVGHYFRHVRLLKPRAFVMENVEGLMDEVNIGFLENALDGLPNYYNVVGPIVVNAADLGAPTKRRRVIVVGYDKRDVDCFGVAGLEKLKSARKVTVREAISDLPAPIPMSKDRADYGWSRFAPSNGDKLSEYAYKCRSMPGQNLGWHNALTELTQGRLSGLFTTKHSQEVMDRFIETEQGVIEPISRYPKLAWNGQCPTLRAGTGADKGSFQAMRPIHPTQPRVITVREAARLQGFPDWFVFHPTKWHSFRMIGNSVSPIVSQAVLSLLHSNSTLRVAA